MGTGKSKGTKVFSLAGKIARGGLIEVPMGITLREMIYEIGGGIPYGKKLKGIQEGMAASNAFLEAISPETDMVRKLELEEQLRRYCRFDTEAMVEIVRFLTGVHA